MRTLFRSALAAAVLALAGCGGGDAPAPDESPAAGLTDYLPAEPFVVAVVDVDEARSELGLEADADATAIERFAEDLEPGDPEYELVQGTAAGLPPIAYFAQAFENDPVIAALDGTAISAAASNQDDPEGPVAVVRTSQGFDELAETLAEDGYQRDGDALVNSEARVTEVADAGDGVIVLSGKGASAVDLAAEPPGGPAELDAVLEPSGGAVRQAAVGLDDGCQTAFGGSERADGDSGVLRMSLDRPADADRVDLKPLRNAGIDPGEPAVDSKTVEIPFEADGGAPPGTINRVTASFAFADLYDCG